MRRVQKSLRLLIMIIFLSTSCFLLPAASPAAEKWSGVDEAIVQKIAKEQGREPHAPLINTDQGDLLLFVFLLAGTIGGFIAGYYWRMLTTEKKKQNDRTGG